jgi:hypothetical protein
MHTSPSVEYDERKAWLGSRNGFHGDTRILTWATKIERKTKSYGCWSEITAHNIALCAIVKRTAR